jgi:hypothetical protein
VDVIFLDHQDNELAVVSLSEEDWALIEESAKDEGIGVSELIINWIRSLVEEKS